MNAQQAYEGIRTFFSRPGAELSKTASGACFYRFDPSKLDRDEDFSAVSADYDICVAEAPLRCAVGCLIPDDKYDPQWDVEHGNLSEIIEYEPEQWAAIFGDDPATYDFLREAQSSHDGAPDVPTFLSALDTDAKRFGLQVAS